MVPPHVRAAAGQRLSESGMIAPPILLRGVLHTRSSNLLSSTSLGLILLFLGLSIIIVFCIIRFLYLRVRPTTSRRGRRGASGPPGPVGRDGRDGIDGPILPDGTYRTVALSDVQMIPLTEAERFTSFKQQNLPGQSIFDRNPRRILDTRDLESGRIEGSLHPLPASETLSLSCRNPSHDSTGSSQYRPDENPPPGPSRPQQGLSVVEILPRDGLRLDFEDTQQNNGSLLHLPSQYTRHECMRTYDEESKLANHTKKHTRYRQCNVCQRCFRRKSDFDKNKMTHTDKRPWEYLLGPLSGTPGD